jgi:hypothetical protein
MLLGHLTDEEDGEIYSYANTNYTWQPASDAITELEAHISQLRHRRQQLAYEAELLWRLLGKKEAEYYNEPEDDEHSDRKLRLRRYVETVGNVHTKI